MDHFLNRIQDYVIVLQRKIIEYEFSHQDYKFIT